MRERRYPTGMTDAQWAVACPVRPVPGRLQGRGGQSEAYGRQAMPDTVHCLRQRNEIASRAGGAGADSRGFDGGTSINGRQPTRASHS